MKLSTPTALFSCSTSIVLKDSTSCRRFNGSFPRSYPPLQVKFQKKIFHDLHSQYDLAVDRPPSLISPLFPVSHRTLENLQTRRRFTRVYGGKIIFVDMYVFCVNVQLFSLFYSSLQQITPIIHKPGKN